MSWVDDSLGNVEIIVVSSSSMRNEKKMHSHMSIECKNKMTDTEINRNISVVVHR